MYKSLLRGKHIFFVIILLLSVLFPVNGKSAQTPDWEAWDDSVIRLLVVAKGGGLDLGVASGTAFAINDQGDYITNHHVIEAAINGGEIGAVESLVPEKIHEVKIVWQSKEYDLAMVHVETWKNKGLVLSDGDQLKKGQDVYSIGFPGAADRNNPAEFNVSTVKKGILSAFKNFSLSRGGRKIKMLEHDAAVNSGNSGGPLADACGRVVGINEQKALSDIIKQGKGVAVNTAEGILFSINSAELMALLDQNKVNYQQNNSPCVLESSSGTLSNTMLTVIIALALLTLSAFIFLYRKVQQLSPDGRINVRTISRVIFSKQAHSKQQSASQTQEKANKPDGRTYYSHEKGRIVHREESTPKVETIQTLYQLVPQHHNLNLHTLALATVGNYRLGRAQGNNIQLVVANQYVSSEHLIIIINPDHSVAVEALNSTNGTQVDSVAMSPRDILPLAVGQILRLGHDDVTYTLQRAKA